MHSSLVRAQSVFGFFTTITFCVAAFVALSTVLFPANPTATVDVRKFRVIKGRAHQYYASKVQEYAFINFDLDADLESLFNWNTKQVFTYISASYPGSKFSENEAVIWDAILPHRSASRLYLKSERAKYNINDITGEFSERENITLSLYWNVQPHIGVLTWGSVGLSEAFTLLPLEGKGRVSAKN
ncbi:signal peptidase 22kDa subunit [Morchella snyderi]|nr:signal peptidase 22kDa subunit [Morchella snyderi]